MHPVRSAYVLDSFALLAYLNAEAGYERVQDILASAQEGNLRVYLCFINLGEVLYLTERRRGLSQAQRVLALVDNLPLHLLDATRELILESAHIKAQYPISYADGFVIAIARRENGIILTGDPDFKSVETLVNVEWLNKN